MFELAFALFDAFLVIVLTALTYCFYNGLLHVRKSPYQDGDLPFVSIMVPARNEEAKIERCLRSLVNQNYPCFEVIVVDDRSTDRTAQIIEQIAKMSDKIRLLKVTSLPDGWIGKCNALAHASNRASGQWFIFTDADTFHQQNSVRDAVTFAMQRRADLVSFVPVQELGSFWERAVMPVLLGSFLCGDPFHTVNNTLCPRAYAYGQYILVSRQAYFHCGGHEAVKQDILEDHALARCVKKFGSILCADGLNLYKVRMYTDLPSLWHGWTKNLYAIIECRTFNLLVVLLLINCAVMGPFVLSISLAVQLASGSTGGVTQLLLLANTIQLATLLCWWQRTNHHYDGLSWKDFFLLPLGSLSVTAIYLHSAYLVLSGGRVNWKGRHYTVNTAKRIEPASKLARASGDPVLAPKTRD